MKVLGQLHFQPEGDLFLRLLKLSKWPHAPAVPGVAMPSLPDDTIPFTSPLSLLLLGIL